jgi:hypothetical protein
MSKTFHIGDHVRWNSEAGLVRGVIVRRLTSNTRWEGYMRHAPTAEPQYVIKSDTTDHIAVHKGTSERAVPAGAILSVEREHGSKVRDVACPRRLVRREFDLRGSRSRRGRTGCTNLVGLNGRLYLIATAQLSNSLSLRCAVERS